MMIILVLLMSCCEKIILCVVCCVWCVVCGLVCVEGRLEVVPTSEYPNDTALAAQNYVEAKLCK